MQAAGPEEPSSQPRPIDLAYAAETFNNASG